MQQILINLLSNAINYTPVDGKVEVKLIEQEAEVIIEVTDNGIGIPAKDIDRVFERSTEWIKHVADTQAAPASDFPSSNISSKIAADESK